MQYVKKNSYNEYNSMFASRLRQLMAQKEISQQKLADYIGVTRQAVSAYTLGVSLPDIEKFEKIACFFDVSTEYLLGRTKVMEMNIEKQLISDKLQLSEEAIDRILDLQQEFASEQNFENKRNTKKEPLAVIFDRWLRFVDLEDLIDTVYQSLLAASKTQEIAYNPEEYQLSEEEKNTIHRLKQLGYITLTPTEQMILYEHKASKIFIKSIEKLQIEVMNATGALCEIMREEADQPENDDSADER